MLGLEVTRSRAITRGHAIAGNGRGAGCCAIRLRDEAHPALGPLPGARTGRPRRFYTSTVDRSVINRIRSATDIT